MRIATVTDPQSSRPGVDGGPGGGVPRGVELLSGVESRGVELLSGVESRGVELRSGVESRGVELRSGVESRCAVEARPGAGVGPLVRVRPARFVGLVVLLTVPIWLLGAVAGQLSGVLPINLPVSALMAVCPFLAVAIAVRRQRLPGGLRGVVRAALDPRRIRGAWYLPILLFMPAVMVGSYVVMALLGRHLPPPNIPWAAVPIFAGVFFAGAAFEEIGWSGVVIDPLQDRWGALRASLALGTVWAAWHVIGWYVQAHHSLAWTAGQFGSTIALRVMITWLYNSTGKSILAAILFHDLINVSEFLFPKYGSHYDPILSGVIILAAVVVVVRRFGGRTLTARKIATT